MSTTPSRGPVADDGALVEAFGARWRLDVEGLGPPLAGRLRELWGRATASGPADGVVPAYVVTRAGDRVLVDGTPYRTADADLPYAVSRAVTHASIRRRAGRCLLLHAAGLSGEDGATLALVAPSGTGKTTAARTLGRRLGYVSDETVAVEADHTVRPYAKPLSVVVDPAVPHGKVESSPDELGLARAPDGLRLAAVVLLERDPSHGAPRLHPVGLVEALAALVPQTSALLDLADPLDVLAAAATAGGGPWRLRYAEVAECGDLASRLLGPPDPSAEPVTWTTEAGDEPVTDEVVGPTDPGRPADEGPVAPVVRRTPFQHALHAEGATLVAARARAGGAARPGLDRVAGRDGPGRPRRAGRRRRVRARAAPRRRGGRHRDGAHAPGVGAPGPGGTGPLTRRPCGDLCDDLVAPEEAVLVGDHVPTAPGGSRAAGDGGLHEPPRGEFADPPIGSRRSRPDEISLRASGDAGEHAGESAPGRKGVLPASVGERRIMRRQRTLSVRHPGRGRRGRVAAVAGSRSPRGRWRERGRGTMAARSRSRSEPSPPTGPTTTHRVRHPRRPRGGPRVILRP